ncbi:glycosyl hydrolase [uncultured Aquimarina sp.]|uniref:glycoside hydrolase family 26 protein n=1 Tax=uncultured Aquimarina sp. TaxID=575652 RepID=UPI002628CDEE|nr:glycosyl hydrolase [uncultured Aquimarina sp.]
MKKILSVFIFLVLVSCSTDEQSLFDPNAERNPPILTNTGVFADANLCQEAKDLYSRLLTITQDGIAFGQQEPFGTGNNFPMPDKLDQDFIEVANDYPAIAGFDLELISLQNSLVINEFIEKFTRAVVNAHENGSIITMSWHMVNPNNSSGILTTVVPDMLEGGMYRDKFVDNLTKASRLFKNLKDSEGNPIPVLFRPWHEMNGDFFYWGEGFRTTEEYKQLYKDTVKILAEDLDVHNLIYIYAPNWVTNSEEYMRNYPGDDYVDMLGVDVYDFKNGNFLQSALRNLQIVEDIATSKNMLFALTETGLENVDQNDWWTESLYKAIRSSSITYAMVWRNDTPSFFHVPFLGHPSVDNFKEFLDKDLMLLSQDIQ